MRVWQIAAVSAVSLSSPGFAQGSGPAYLCEARAHGEAGDEVDVLIGVNPDGSLMPGSALWFPAVAASSGPEGFDIPDAALGVVFQRSSGSGIGQPIDIMVTIATVSPPRQQLGYGFLQKRLDGYRFEYAVDRDPPKPLELRKIGEDQTPPGTATRSTSLGQMLPLPQDFTVRIVPNKRGEATMRRYGMHPTTGRDKLFDDAWREALAKTKEPAAKCQRQ